MIRPIENLNELDQLFLIEKELFNHHAYAYEQLEEMYDNDDYEILGYFDDQDELLEGYLILLKTADHFEIIKIGTAQHLQNQGIGTKMLDVAKQYDRPLILEVSENNQKAINFYLKNGFNLLNERREYYQDGSNALIMEFKKC